MPGPQTRTLQSQVTKASKKKTLAQWGRSSSRATISDSLARARPYRLRMAPGRPPHARIRDHALRAQGQHLSHGTPHRLSAETQDFVLTGRSPAVPARRFDAVLVDIDHSPDFLLDPQNAAFYGEQGLSQLAAHLRPGGIFALWSNDRLDDAFTARLRRVFADARAEEVTFHNPLQDKPFTQTVYLAKKPAVPHKT